jgi:hypothetical protein
MLVVENVVVKKLRQELKEMISMPLLRWVFGKKFVVTNLF